VKSCVVACLAALALQAEAAEPSAARDPMRPPPVVQRAAADPLGASAAAPVAPPAPVARHLLVVDGQRYVIEGSRRRAVGDKLGEARIERIEDMAVIVSNEGVRQRIPLFAGVDKRPVAEGAAASAPAASAPSRARRAVTAATSRTSTNVSPR
jgi:hypothetical protein